MTVFFRDLTSPEIQAAAQANTLLLLPLGQTEEHGNHLPVGTDSFIAENVCAETARRLAGKIPTLVLPTVEYGYSSRIMTRWAGTFTLPPRLVTDLLVEICKSVVRMGFAKIVIVNSHGHHHHIAVVAAREIADQTGAEVAVLMPNSLIGEEFARIRKSDLGGACHGGEYETSLMMHFGHDIRLDKADNRDVLRSDSEFCSKDMLNGGGNVFWSTWARQPSHAGIYGDPTVATAQTGKKTFDAIIDRLARFCIEYHGFKPTCSGA